MIVICFPTPYTHAQQNASMPPINYTKLFSENNEFQYCFDQIPQTGRCLPVVDVLYQDGSTVTLSSDYVDIIWKAVAEVKKSGFKVDAMTSYPDTERGGTDVNILVVMSR
jgi:hypothetical protein